MRCSLPALAEDIVFNSPLLVRPIVGRNGVAGTLIQSGANRGSRGHYVLERKIDANTTLLRWKGMGLVGAQGDGAGPVRARLDHRQGGDALGVAVGGGQASVLVKRSSCVANVDDCRPDAHLQFGGADVVARIICRAEDSAGHGHIRV